MRTFQVTICRILFTWQVLPGFLNGCILIFVISASNSDLYIASRTLYSLALGGSAPSIIAKTDQRGVPIVALGISASFCCLAYMNIVEASATVFKYLYVSGASVADLKAWTWSPYLDCSHGSQSWCHILASWRFHPDLCGIDDQCIKAQGIERKRDLPYYSPLGEFGTWFALVFCIIIAIFKISSFEWS